MLLLYALVMAQLAVFAITTVLAARVVGAQIRVIALGMPAVLRVRSARPEIRIGPLPNGMVDIVDMEELPRVARLVLAVSPWLVVLGIAVACLGVEPALRMFGRGFVQLVFTVDVTPLVRRMVEIARTAPVAVTTGILFAKLAAMNLVPFGGTGGGLAIRALFTRRGANPRRALDNYVMLTMALWMVWTLARFGWALVQVARG